MIKTYQQFNEGVDDTFKQGVEKYHQAIIDDFVIWNDYSVAKEKIGPAYNYDDTI
jgi:hypothetical protein